MSTLILSCRCLINTTTLLTSQCCRNTAMFPVQPQPKKKLSSITKKYINTLLDKCAETAVRCGALVFVNTLCDIGGNYRNSTYAFNKNGEIVGKYFKKHLPPLEQEVLKPDSDYTFEFSEPYILEIDGL